MTTETRHIPGIRTRAGLNTLTDDELINRALDSDDYTTRRLALVASMKQAQLDQARELLEVLEESYITTPEALRLALDIAGDEQ